jgi:peptide/nickel transport system ATP-binding protein
MSRDAILHVENLRHVYVNRAGLGRRDADAVAVDGVSFDVGRGETYGVVGESGSGKTTIARIVSGLRVPTSGVVRFDGRDVYVDGRPRTWLHRRVQIVLQDPYSSLNPRARIAKILARPLIVRGDPRAARRKRVAELIDLVGLPPEVAARHPAALSGGQRQRVAIARALAVEPELLVLDEPTSALDLTTQGQIVSLLRELQQALRLTFVFVSHNLALVACICDRTLVMHKGKAVEEGHALELYRNPSHDYTRELMAAVVTPRKGLHG